MSQALLDVGFAHDRTTGKEDWLTPPHVLRSLGAFDLDPCAPIGRPWDMAAQHYTLEDNGLNKTEQWVSRLAQHGDGISLIFARTETSTFFPWVWDYARALFFLKGRLRFYTREGREGGGAGAPSVLIAYGEQNVSALRHCGLPGKLVLLS